MIERNRRKKMFFHMYYVLVMSSATKHDIDRQFGSRLTRPDMLVGRPTNPFAKPASHDNQSTFFENLLRPAVSMSNKLGTVYNGYVVDTKNEETIVLDTYTVSAHPKAGYKLHSVDRMSVEHTREK